MSIFGRDESNETPHRPQPPSPAPTPPVQARASSNPVTLISPGTKVEGEISGSTEIKVEGFVDGTINVDSVVSIGSGGQVSGEIRAKSITVAGQVIGNIVGIESVDIHASGKLEGDVKAPRVAVADGAYFKGRVEMTSEAPRSAEPGTQPVPKPAEVASSGSTAGSAGSVAGKETRPDVKSATGPVTRDALKASESNK